MTDACLRRAKQTPAVAVAIYPGSSSTGNRLPPSLVSLPIGTLFARPLSTMKSLSAPVVAAALFVAGVAAQNFQINTP